MGEALTSSPFVVRRGRQGPKWASLALPLGYPGPIAPDGQLYNESTQLPSPGTANARSRVALHRFLLAGVSAAAVPAIRRASAALSHHVHAGRAARRVVLDNAASWSQVTAAGHGRIIWCFRHQSAAANCQGWPFQDQGAWLTLGMVTVACAATMTASYPAQDDRGWPAKHNVPGALPPPQHRRGVSTKDHDEHDELIQETSVSQIPRPPMRCSDRGRRQGSGRGSAVFAWSYQGATAEATAFFRLLGLHRDPVPGSRSSLSPGSGTARRSTCSTVGSGRIC